MSTGHSYSIWQMGTAQVMAVLTCFKMFQQGDATPCHTKLGDTLGQRHMIWTSKSCLWSRLRWLSMANGIRCKGSVGFLEFFGHLIYSTQHWPSMIEKLGKSCVTFEGFFELLWRRELRLVIWVAPWSRMSSAPETLRPSSATNRGHDRRGKVTGATKSSEMCKNESCMVKILWLQSRSLWFSYIIGGTRSSIFDRKRLQNGTTRQEQEQTVCSAGNTVVFCESNVQANPGFARVVEFGWREIRRKSL